METFIGRIELSSNHDKLLISNEGRVSIFEMNDFMPILTLKCAGRFAYYVKDKVLYQPEIGVLALYNIQDNSSSIIYSLDKSKIYKYDTGCEFVYFNGWLAILTNEGLNVFKLVDELIPVGKIPFKVSFPFFYGYSNSHYLIINAGDHALEVFDLLNLKHRVIKSKYDDGWSFFGGCTIDPKNKTVIVESGGVTYSSSIAIYSLITGELISENEEEYYIRESYNLVLNQEKELLIPIMEVGNEEGGTYSLAFVNKESMKICSQYYFEKQCVLGNMQHTPKQELIALDIKFNLYYWESHGKVHTIKKNIGYLFEDIEE